MNQNQIPRIIALFFIFVSLQSFAHDHHDNMMDEAVERPSGDSLYNIHSKWQTQDGKEISFKSLQGHPVVMAMAYTSCQSSCPLIVEEMKQIESHFPHRGSALFVLVSFDSKRDTPERLRKFAEQRKLDSSWLLLHGSPSSVQELAAVLGVRYKEDSQGEFDHSNLISVLDSKGVVRFQQAGLNKGQKELEQKISDLMKDR